MGPYTQSAVDMLDFWKRLQEWSKETFGPKEHRGPTGPIKHLIKEAAGELLGIPREKVDQLLSSAKPIDFINVEVHEEIVDLLFLVFDASWRSGLSYSKLSSMAKEKLKENIERSWPDWRQADPNHAIEHHRKEGEGRAESR